MPSTREASNGFETRLSNSASKFLSKEDMLTIVFKIAGQRLKGCIWIFIEGIIVSFNIYKYDLPIAISTCVVVFDILSLNGQWGDQACGP